MLGTRPRPRVLLRFVRIKTCIRYVVTLKASGFSLGTHMYRSPAINSRISAAPGAARLPETDGD
eukprot:3687547-Prymnesium_polylepis.2